MIDFAYIMLCNLFVNLSEHRLTAIFKMGISY